MGGGGVLGGGESAGGGVPAEPLVRGELGEGGVGQDVVEEDDEVVTNQEVDEDENEDEAEAETYCPSSPLK